MTTKITRENAATVASWIIEHNIPPEHPLAIGLKKWWKAAPRSLNTVYELNYPLNEAQKLLDEGYPKYYVAEKFNISVERVSDDIARGKLNTDLWIKNKKIKHDTKIYRFYKNSIQIDEGSIQEISKDTGIPVSTLRMYATRNASTKYKVVLLRKETQWMKRK